MLSAKAPRHALLGIGDPRECFAFAVQANDMLDRFDVHGPTRLSRCQLLFWCNPEVMTRWNLGATAPAACVELQGLRTPRRANFGP
eukprot:13915228-Alexandrium_andersonii.AAC.1